jgi:Copper type II ascorbate-dependent monooxygenase, C-terminal domain
MSRLTMHLSLLSGVALSVLAACEEPRAEESRSSGLAGPVVAHAPSPQAADAPRALETPAPMPSTASSPAPLDPVAASTPALAGETKTPESLPSPGANKSRGFPCAVAETVQKYCASCHAGDEHGDHHGPLLGSAPDFRATSADGTVLSALAKQKLNASDPHKTMPPAGYPKPSAEELATLNAWLDRGAPDSSETCASLSPPAPHEHDDTSGLTCYPLLAHDGDLRTPYKVGIAHDAYIAFTFAPPWKSTEYGMLVRALIDQKEAVHHVILFEDLTPATPGVRESTQIHPDSLMIAGWTPGNPSMDFRKLSGEDVGLELRTDRTYTVELHYNSENAQLSDRSGFEVCARKQPPKNVASYAWVGRDNLLFPADKWVGNCKPHASEPIRLLSIMPHMHLKGIHFKATLNRLDGSQLVFHDLPFDFRFERQYPVNLTLFPGESITTECTYSEPKSYGPNVEDEMCTLFTMHYPKGTLVDDGLWSVLHGGGACLGE